MDENLVESAVFRAVGFLVTEVPFAEDAGGVAGGLENLGQGDSFQGHPFPLEDGVGDAVLELVPAAEHGGTGWGAGRAEVKLGEKQALLLERIDSRRLHDGSAKTGVVAVADVVGHDEDDVGWWGGGVKKC